MKQLVLGLVVTLIIQNLTGVSTLRCYSCDSCNDPFGGSDIVTCEGSCVKSNIDGLITRGCSNITLVAECSQDKHLVVCVCDTNLCNKTQGKHTFLFGPYIASIIYFLLHTLDKYHN